MIDPDTLAGALAPLGAATMLPAVAYTSAEVLEWERRHLFAGTWSCVGREPELRGDGLPAPSTQRAIRVGGIGVLLTWSTRIDEERGRHRPAADRGSTATSNQVAAGGAAPATGTGQSQQPRLRAFANTCRHRGHELLPEGDTSDRQSIVCPYHAWSYRLDGAVRATPGVARGSAGSGSGSGSRPDADDLGLVELPVRRWGGWVFVHAAHPVGDPAVPSFEAHVGALADVAGPYRTERLVRRARHTYEVAANWKVLTENYHECYHCPLIHPELCQVSPPDSGDNYDLPGEWVGGAMVLREGAETMSLSGHSAGQPLPGVDQRRVEYLGLLPDLLLSLHPDYVMSHRLLPLAPDRTWVECSWYFAGTAEPIDPSYAVEFWDITNRQDWAACESVQRGLSSPHFRPGPFAANEDAVHRFVRMVAQHYLGPAAVDREPPITAGAVPGSQAVE